MHFQNCVRSFLVAIVSTALLGCASAPPTQLDPAAVKGSHGFVAAVAPIGWYAAPPSITLKARASDTKVQLQASGGAFRLYTGWIPAGEYDIEEMFGPGQDSSLPPITVVAGRATDLGGLRLFDVGEYETVLVAFSHPELTRIVAPELTTHKLHLNGEPLAWQPTTLPPPRAASHTPPNLGIVVALMMEYERSVNKPSALKQLRAATRVDEFLSIVRRTAVPTIDEAARDELGTIYFGGDFGQVRARTTGGEWTSVDTGTTVPVTAVHASGRQLTAGTRDGQLRRREAPGADWELVRQLGKDEAVIDIDSSGQRWFVLTVKSPYTHATPQLLRPEGIRLYSATRADLSDLALLRTFEFNLQTIIQQLRARGEVFRSYYYVNGISALARQNLATSAWEELDPGHQVSHFRIAPQSGTITAYAAGGAFSKLSISTDAAKTFVREETPSYPVNDVFFLSADSAIASRWSMGAFSADLQTLRFDPTKKRWAEIATFDPASCARMLREPAGVTWFCVTRSGSILRVDGKRLVTEFAAD